jgi:hypothetical protein
MGIGMRVRIRREAIPFYRNPATPVEGVVMALSPLGSVARVHIDGLGDSYVRTDDLELVY